MNKEQIVEILNRKELEVSSKEIHFKFNDKSILITGAAGSIGRELVLKLSKFSYRYLICLDQSESQLFALSKNFNFSESEKCKFLVANIRDSLRIEKIFKEYKPDIVFHAAAYKQVPMMEEHVYEVTKTNVFGSKIMMDLAIKYQVGKFVLISTDKAVYPKSIMGATKRIAELYVKAIERRRDTSFIIARFGNVIETSGSVITNFKKNIKLRAPLEVTDKLVSRYFMTKQEACQLILTAGVFGINNDMFVFDMGKPVHIFELAKKMIEQAGLSYPAEIDIKFIGLRKGEKLEEDLLYNDEKSESTDFERIKLIKSDKLVDAGELEKQIAHLSKICQTGDDFEIIKAIQIILPDFIYSGQLNK